MSSWKCFQNNFLFFKFSHCRLSINHIFVFCSLPLYPSWEKFITIVSYLIAKNFPKVLPIKLVTCSSSTRQQSGFWCLGGGEGWCLFIFSFKSNLGTTKTNTLRSGELLKGDTVEYITLSDVRIEMAHSINALQTLLESTWAAPWQRTAAAGHETLILICAAYVYVLLDFYFYEDSQPCNSVHITSQFTHAEEILNPGDKSSRDRTTKLYAGYSTMLIAVLPRWSCSLHYVIQPSNSSVRVWKAKRRLYWEPVKNKRPNLYVAISKCCLNQSFVKK